MPFKFTAKKGTLARPSQRGKTKFECCINTGSIYKGGKLHCTKCRQCSAMTKRKDPVTGRFLRCRLSTCKDFRYCHVHLRTLKKIAIAKSRYINGMGLFCMKKTDRVVPPAQRRKQSHPLLIFKPNDHIADFYMKKAPARQNKLRYRYKNNQGNWVYPAIPYGISTQRNKIFDDACLRYAADYANDPKGTGKQPNAQLVVSSPTKARIKAIKKIYVGDEILWKYNRGGGNYWRTSGPRYLTISNKYVSPFKNR